MWIEGGGRGHEHESLTVCVYSWHSVVFGQEERKKKGQILRTGRETRNWSGW